MGERRGADVVSPYYDPIAGGGQRAPAAAFAMMGPQRGAVGAAAPLGSVLMSRIIAFCALALLLVGGGLLLALRPEAAPQPEAPAEGERRPRPLWGSVALQGMVMRYRPEDGGLLEVIYARRESEPGLPRAWVRAHPSARITAWPAEGPVLRALYKELADGGFFDLEPGPDGAASLAVFDGRRCFSARVEEGAAFAPLVAAFERAAARARAAPEAAAPQASGG